MENEQFLAEFCSTVSRISMQRVEISDIVGDHMRCEQFQAGIYSSVSLNLIQIVEIGDMIDDHFENEHSQQGSIQRFLLILREKYGMDNIIGSNMANGCYTQLICLNILFTLKPRLKINIMIEDQIGNAQTLSEFSSTISLTSM